MDADFPIFGHMKTYDELLRSAISETGSVLCVGLDPDLKRIPDDWRQIGESPASVVYRFCKTAIEASFEFASSYKPNLAFFEVLGRDGLKVFADVCDLIPGNRLIIADAKRGDIGNTAERYAEAFLDTFNCDAITVSPLMGMETLHAFTTKAEKAIYVLTLTSNPGAADFLEQSIASHPSLALSIAEKLNVLNSDRPAHIGMVIGATRPDAMEPLLHAFPEGGLLLPGVGAQGGDIEAMIAALINHRGTPVVPISRGILFGDDMSQNGIQQRTLHYHSMLESLSRRYV